MWFSTISFRFCLLLILFSVWLIVIIVAVVVVIGGGGGIMFAIALFSDGWSDNKPQTFGFGTVFLSLPFNSPSISV